MSFLLSIRSIYAQIIAWISVFFFRLGSLIIRVKSYIYTIVRYWEYTKDRIFGMMNEQSKNFLETI